MKLTKQRLKQIIREELGQPRHVTSMGAPPPAGQRPELDGEDESRHMEELWKVLQDCADTLVRGVGAEEALEMMKSEMEVLEQNIESQKDPELSLMERPLSGRTQHTKELNK